MGVAFLASLTSFKQPYSKHLRFFSLVLALTFVVEFVAVFGRRWGWISSNIILYNTFMLIEFTAYIWYFHQVIRNPKVKRRLRFLLVALPIFWTWSTLAVFGIGIWNSYVSTAGSLITVIMAAYYYYELFTASELVRLNRSAEFWIATGLIVFYACHLPYLGMLNYLTVNHMPLARQLLTILQIGVCIMYSIFIYAYLCKINIAKS
jgi:hypothetical protein